MMDESLDRYGRVTGLSLTEFTLALTARPHPTSWATGRSATCALGHGVGKLLRHLKLHHPILDPDRECADRQDRRQAEGGAGAQIEARAVQRTLDGAAVAALLDLTLGQ